MQERSRTYLRNEFDDGERPSGVDFSDFIQSCLNVVDDGISVDGNGNVNIPGGVNLGNAPAGQPGTLRFNAGQVEVFNGGAFQPIDSGGGAFQPVGASTDVAYQTGNVGIGNFGAPPPHRLDVPLGDNTGPAERVRMGNLVVHNGPAGSGNAYISHLSVAANNDAFALEQDNQGNTTVNSPNNAILTLRQNGAARLQVLSDGNVTITPATGLTVSGNLLVTGQAFKPGGGAFTPLSDERVKKDIRPLDHGLEAIRQLNPIYFKYNKKSGLQDDKTEYVGLIAQNVEEHLPFLIQESAFPGKGIKGEPLKTYDQGPLEFIMINAIKELAQRVEELEATVRELQQ